MNGNSITIEGNLVADPELRYTPSGVALAKFAVARSYKLRDSEEERTSFFDCVVWNDQAENVGHSLHKGDRVLLSGSLEQSRWQADDGTNRSRHEIRVDSVGPALRWATAAITKVKGNGSSPTPPTADKGGDDLFTEEF